MWDGTRVIIKSVTVQLQLISAYPPKNEAKCNLAYSNPYVFLIYQLPSRGFECVSYTFLT